jgi:hypothetical protein
MKNIVKQKPISSSEIEKYFTYKLEQEDIEKNRRLMCDYTSLVNYHTSDLEMAWGTLWIWDKKWKQYRCCFNHHTWNLDEDDNVYDDYYSLKTFLDIHNVNTVDIERDSYKYVESSELFTSSSMKSGDKKIAETLKNKFSTKGYKSKPKIVFLSGIGWDYNDNPYSWERMEEKWKRIEKDEIIDEIQK